MTDCIFCKIAKKEINSQIVYEDDLCIAFKDISPQAPVHILLIPKKHIESIDKIDEDDKNLISVLVENISKVAKKVGLESYRVVSNVGTEAGQSVFHLHFHILGGRKMNWPPG
ncbi:MAG: histidine triad nucleotide-binding protein [candidate division WOR-3 bacterium]|jgi:histidine triad (HIT) family protein